MENLRQIQSLFWRSISQKQESKESQQDLQKLADLNRIAVYKETVLTAHLNALLASYPVTASLLGSKLFNGLAKGYIYFYLPTEPNLNQYGLEFPQWLLTASMEIDEIKQCFDKIDLKKLAEFEWAMEQGYYAEDQFFSEQDLQKLHQSPHDELKFQFHPAVSTFRFEQNISALLYSDKQDMKMVSSLNQTPEILMVYRDTWQMKYQKLSELEKLHSEWIQKELSFEAIKQKSQFHEPVIAEWIQKGIVSRVSEIEPT